MTISEKLCTDLENVLSGDPWYGSPVYDILEKASFETAYEKTGGAVHNIAGIVLHMLSWTEEVIDRLNGQTAQLPSSGDWPEPGDPDEQKWQQYVNDFKLVNVNLLHIIRNFPEDKWDEPVPDERDRALGTEMGFEELVRGLIQHHIYHSGQIAILTRVNSLKGTGSGINN
ncbi:MAG TPA: DinB family protein [Mucilaginibacter sp.]|nr:DinB family protein [Mucilaginibacter sp.]